MLQPFVFFFFFILFQARVNALPYCKILYKANNNAGENISLSIPLFFLLYTRTPRPPCAFQLISLNREREREFPRRA